MKIYPITLDLIRATAIPKFRVRTGDRNSVQIQTTIQSDYTPFDLTGYTVTMTFLKPDKTTATETAILTDALNGVATATLALTTYDQVGNYEGQVTLTKGTEIDIVPSRFYFVCLASL